MERLRVLVACDIDRNPYVRQLIRALHADSGVASVQHGVERFESSEESFDVIHIQWPEALVRWGSPSPAILDGLRANFNRWRSRGAAIVATVHNEVPHRRDGEAYRKVFELVYGNADVAVHLGQRSIEAMRQRYGAIFDGLVNVVIPHGNSEWFVSGRESGSCRAEIGVARDQAVVLAVGAVRKEGEARLLCEVADCLRRDPRALLVVAGRLPFPSRRRLKFYSTRAPFWLRRNLKLYDQVLSDAEMEQFVVASDVVLIPRIQALNSGNVALAYTFGKVAVGPAVGVIGDELAGLGNPTFVPGDSASICRAIAAAIRLAKEGAQGTRNLEYARTELDWTRSGAAHVRAYREALRRRGGHGLPADAATQRFFCGYREAIDDQGGTDHGHNGAGWGVSCGVPVGEGL